jgi:hypothetical protein
MKTQQGEGDSLRDRDSENTGAEELAQTKLQQIAAGGVSKKKLFVRGRSINKGRLVEKPTLKDDRLLGGFSVNFNEAH